MVLKYLAARDRIAMELHAKLNSRRTMGGWVRQGTGHVPLVSRSLEIGKQKQKLSDRRIARFWEESDG
jgi:hypothetical protein